MASLTFLGPGGCEPLAVPSARATTPSTLGVASRGTFVERLVLTGEIDAERAVRLSGPPTEDGALVVRWLAEDGAPVSEGDRIAGFDTMAAMARVRELEMSLLDAESALVEHAADHEVTLDEKWFAVAKSEVNVAKARLDADIPEDLLSRREARNFALALARAQAELANARGDAEATRRVGALEEKVKTIALTKAERALRAATRQLQGLDLVAPAAGIASIESHPWHDRKIRVGDLVWSGLPIVRLPDLSKLVVRARLDDVDDGKIHPGQTAACVIDAWPRARLSGRVVSVSPVAQELAQYSTRRSFAVVVALDGEAPGALRPGLSVRVEVEIVRLEDATVVPRAAIAFDGEGSRVRMADGSSVSVEPLACNLRECTLAPGGIEPGAVVVGWETPS